MAGREALVFGFLLPSGLHRGSQRPFGKGGGGSPTALGPRVDSRWHPADRLHAGPLPDGAGWGRPASRGRSVSSGHRPLQRHGGGCRGPRLCGQFRLRPAQGRSRAQRLPGAGRSGRHGGLGGGRVEVSQRNGHHAGWEDPGGRRDLRQSADRVRYRVRWDAGKSPGVRGTGGDSSRWDLP